jgi:hypothetical protein
MRAVVHNICKLAGTHPLPGLEAQVQRRCRFIGSGLSPYGRSRDRPLAGRGTISLRRNHGRLAKAAAE